MPTPRVLSRPRAFLRLARRPRVVLTFRYSVRMASSLSFSVTPTTSLPMTIPVCLSTSSCPTWRPARLNSSHGTSRAAAVAMPTRLTRSYPATVLTSLLPAALRISRLTIITTPSMFSFAIAPPPPLLSRRWLALIKLAAVLQSPCRLPRGRSLPVPRWLEIELFLPVPRPILFPASRTPTARMTYLCATSSVFQARRAWSAPRTCLALLQTVPLIPLKSVITANTSALSALPATFCQPTLRTRIAVATFTFATSTTPVPIGPAPTHAACWSEPFPRLQILTLVSITR
jgi:hypothetical protein